MLTFALRRAVLGLLVLATVALLVFVAIRFVPGDIVNQQLSEAGAVTPELLEQKRAQLGLDKPIATQFVLWARDVLAGDLGNSLWTGRPVASQIGAALIPTMQLSILAIALGAVLGIGAGVASALWRGTPGDMVLRVSSTVFLAIPQLWMGLLMLTGLAAIGYFIPLPYRSFSDAPFVNLQQVVFPAIALALGVAAALSRLTRSAMLEIIGADFIRAARARGVSSAGIYIGHGLKNALIPVITLVGTQFGHLLSGTVIIERIFNVPGLGNMLFEAVATRDYPVLQAAVLTYGLITITVNLLVDLSYGMVDPRVREARS
ncbi:peptide/nickel transport system permease protein [Pseudaminobacter salicylatoxidans]|uniref:Peptide/nickel transport system permease protein n=1 Tax=Pseudaminobacter salicylatoxidans TaxID=93369 RepID=A0A316CBW6_PSESE|nr:ABC transporter permease [Pseudaminobacter salicylatoxidans]PWJ86596.1 peptide/nickel transport system permease protein [Pseudaminobacter salicylatoxidans]